MECLGGLPLAFWEFRLRGRHKNEKNLVHDPVMEKVRALDFQGALEILEDFRNQPSGNNDRAWFLQERGILRRMAGDLHGALQDLTSALEICENDYECLKHRGYVKYLIGNEDGARRDALRCMAMEPRVDGIECSGGLPVAFLEFRLKGRKENDVTLSHKEVMQKVKALDFQRALAILDDVAAKVPNFYDRLFLVQKRGILKRMAGDLPGALEDLTASLEKGDDYDCFKHRDYVKYLMGDQMEQSRCLKQSIVVISLVGCLDLWGVFPHPMLRRHFNRS